MLQLVAIDHAVGDPVEIEFLRYGLRERAFAA
jgi:hypothetical protein